jgi:hypothetical protein
VATAPGGPASPGTVVPPAVTVTVTTAPPVASVPVEQALGELRAGVNSIGDADLVNDLGNYVENIARILSANRSADVRDEVEDLRVRILTRSTELDEDGLRMSPQTRDALLASVDQLKRALGYLA